jgi:hypothetical protein
MRMLISNTTKYLVNGFFQITFLSPNTGFPTKRVMSRTGRMSRRFIRGSVAENVGNGQREWVARIGCGWFLTQYPADLDPLDTTLRHLLQTLPDPNAKDPSAW